MIRFIDASLLPEETRHLDKAFGLFECMISAGNHIAAHRINELRRLDTMLTEYAPKSSHSAALHSSPCSPPNNPSLQQDKAIPHWVTETRSVLAEDHVVMNNGDTDLVNPATSIGSGFGEDLTAEQILTLAESLDVEETDWLSSVMYDQGYSV